MIKPIYLFVDENNVEYISTSIPVIRYRKNGKYVDVRGNNFSEFEIPEDAVIIPTGSIEKLHNVKLKLGEYITDCRVQPVEVEFTFKVVTNATGVTTIYNIVADNYETAREELHKELLNNYTITSK